jgi:hypothetical protein
VATEWQYVLSLGSQQGNRHVHWHLVAQPPALSYREQHLGLLPTSIQGVLPSMLNATRSWRSEFAPA